MKRLALPSSGPTSDRSHFVTAHSRAVSTATAAVFRHTNWEKCMQEKAKREWSPPKVQKYGTFEEATQYCDKTFGGTDGFTFMGDPISCAS